MELIDRSMIYRYHHERMEKFGAGTTRALGWKTEANQQKRFEVLSQIGDMNGLSVLDVGCGHGDLRGFLHQKYPDLRYAGIDQMEEFLDVAIERYGSLPETAFYLGDIWTAELPNMDYVLACGLLSYRNSQTGFIYRMIEKLFSSARLGLGFNLLKKVDHPGGLLVAYDPEKILSFCKDLTPKVALREGYTEDDFTVLMYR